jgi:hypothetical protein
MSPAAPENPPTARLFLFGGADSAEVLAQSLHRGGVTGTFGEGLRGLSRAGRQAVGAEVADVTGGLLDLDLGDILLGGWHKHADLIAAARRTVSAPGSREVVELATHRVTSTHLPYVDLFVDDVRVSRVHFELSVEFLVHAVVGTVGDGRLLELASGHCEVTAILAAQGRQLVTRQARLELPLMVGLGAGVLLVDPASLDVVPGEPTQPTQPTRTTHDRFGGSC